MSTKHLYLPALGVSNSVAPPEQPGVWSRHRQSIFLDIARHIQIDESAIRRGASSVPDVWARLIGFQAALRKKFEKPESPAHQAEAERQSQLHERAVREWRGMLSLLALHRVHKWKVEFVPVDIDKVQGPLTVALNKLAPSPLDLERGGPAYKWTDLILIRCEGVPVGGFSPATLVFTGADYNRHLTQHPEVTLQDSDGFLTPPTGRTDLKYVAEWVTQLQLRLNGQGSDTSVVLNGEGNARTHVDRINEMLDEWLRDLQRELGGVGRPAFDHKDVEVVGPDESAGRGIALLERYRVYGELCRPLDEVADAKRRPSDLTLAFTRNQTAYQHIVVISRALLRPETKIWDATRLEHVGGSAAAALESYFAERSGTKIHLQDLQPKKALWVRPELYFLADELLMTEDGKPFLTAEFRKANALDEIGARFVLPFRREILDFFSPDDIRERLQPQFKPVEGGVSFTFQLPVGDPDSPEMVVVERTYRYKKTRLPEGTVVSGTVPTIEMYPKPREPHWRRYYILSDGTDLSAVPLLSPLEGGESPPVHLTEREHSSAGRKEKTRVIAISRDRAYPEALELQPNGKAAPRGLILTLPPVWQPARRDKWTIGIDFGTSNTNVFRIKPDADEAERMSLNFDSHLVHVTASDEARRQGLLRDFLLPDARIELPIPTALRVHPAVNRARFDAEIPDPLLDSFIHFPGAGEFVLPDSVRSDIKWDTENSQHILSFLECLLFLVLVDVADSDVQEVTLTVSYPKAFSADSVVVYKRNWEQVFERLLHGPHRVLSVAQNELNSGKIKIKKPIFGKEGVAAGYFFKDRRTAQKHQAAIDLAALCLDVGGGTTDISLWHGGNISMDASVLLAGRQVSGLLQRNERIVGYLFEQDAAAALEQKKREPTAFAARLNIILKEQEPKIQQRLVLNARRPEIQWLRQMIAIEFGAIAFYSAALVGAAEQGAEAGQGGVLEHVVRSGIKLHWGGNAAKFINWIDHGTYEENGIGSRLLNAILYNALLDLGITPNENGLKQQQSPHHKSETAGGLVVMAPFEFDGLKRAPSAGMPPAPVPIGDSLSMPMSASTAAPAASQYAMPTGADGIGLASSEGVVCGEQIELKDGRVIGPLDRISETLMFQGDQTQFKATTLARLSRFVDIVNYFGVNGGLFNDETRIDLGRYALDISNAMVANHVAAQRLGSGRRSIEPIFIAEVKKLLELMRDDVR